MESPVNLSSLIVVCLCLFTAVAAIVFFLQLMAVVTIRPEGQTTDPPQERRP